MRPAYHPEHRDRIPVRAVRIVRFHVDQLFAGFGILGSVLILLAGRHDASASTHNAWLTLSGAIGLGGEAILLLFGTRGRSVGGPLYCLSSLALLASGLGLAGLSAPSAGEIVTGILVSLGAFSVFYGDSILAGSRIRDRISGPALGSIFYNISCVPLLAAGIMRSNPYEWGAALAFIAGDIVVACRPNPSDRPTAP